MNRSGRSWSGGLRGDGDVAAEIAQATDKAMDDLGAVAAVEVVDPEVGVLDAVAEHEVGGGEHRGGHGQDGLLGSTACLDPKELGVEVAVLHPHASPRAGHKRG